MFDGLRGRGGGGRAVKTARPILSLCAALLALLPPASAAPADGDVSRVEQSRRRQVGPDREGQSRREPLVPWGQTPASPGAEDLGEQIILKRQVKATPFRPRSTPAPARMAPGPRRAVAAARCSSLPPTARSPSIPR